MTARLEIPTGPRAACAGMTLRVDWLLNLGRVGDWPAIAVLVLTSPSAPIAALSTSRRATHLKVSSIAA